MTEQGKPIQLDTMNHSTLADFTTSNFQNLSQVNSERNSISNDASQRIDNTKPIMTLNNPPRNLYRVISACSWGLGTGMTAGVIGSLLPFIEAYYKVNYAIVSLLWLGLSLIHI